MQKNILVTGSQGQLGRSLSKITKANNAYNFVFIDKETFIHASTSKGVTISRFDEKYWSERFRCGGKYPGKK